MAEIAASMTIQNLESLLKEESLRKFHTEITHIMDELKKIKDIWSDLGGQVRIGELSREMRKVALEVLSREVRKVALETVDLLEDYVFQYRIQQPPFDGFGTYGFIHRIKHFFNKHSMIKRDINLASHLQSIKVEIEDISKAMNGSTVAARGSYENDQRTASASANSISYTLQLDRPCEAVIYLPCHLKARLLYLRFFPEDYVIQCSKLLRLWAAHGFCCLETRNDTNSSLTKEQIAKHYLDELSKAGFIKKQVTDLYGRARTCCIQRRHLRPILEIEPSHIDFAEISQHFTSARDADDAFPEPLRRRLPELQLFSASGQSLSLDSSTISIFLSGKIKLLKVLDLEGIPLKEFPGEVLTNLYFLRYLGINSKTFSLPSYLGRLINLETLVLKGLFFFKLPDEILQLKHLRIILGDLLELPKRIGEMTTLEKLNLVVGYDGIEGELRKLTRLRSLCIVHVMKEDGRFELSSLVQMSYLRALYLRSSSPLHGNPAMRNFPPSLQSLTLGGLMNDYHRQILSLENLAQLKLSYSEVRDVAFFKDLQQLPKLVELVLEMDAIVVSELHFLMQSFPKLITLELHGLSALERITVEDGAMPCIENIRFINCPLVKNVPVGIEHLRTLKKIDLAKMAPNLEGELRSHCWKLHHSPTVQSFVDEYDIDSSTSLVDELDMEF